VPWRKRRADHRHHADSIDVAEDRERFQKLIKRLKLLQPPNATARAADEAIKLAEKIGYPLVVRPSYVLGGRAMQIVHTREELETYMRERCACRGFAGFARPLPERRHRSGRGRGERRQDRDHRWHHGAYRGSRRALRRLGLLLPPYSLSKKIQDELRRQTVQMAKALKVVA